MNKRGVVRRIAKNVKLWRNHRKLSQEQLARKVKVSTSYISMIEHGQRAASVIVLDRVARKLGTGLGSLVC